MTARQPSRGRGGELRDVSNAHDQDALAQVLANLARLLVILRRLRARVPDKAGALSS